MRRYEENSPFGVGIAVDFDRLRFLEVYFPKLETFGLYSKRFEAGPGDDKDR